MRPYLVSCAFRMIRIPSSIVVPLVKFSLSSLWHLISSSLFLGKSHRNINVSPFMTNSAEAIISDRMIARKMCAYNSQYFHMQIFPFFLIQMRLRSSIDKMNIDLNLIKRIDENYLIKSYKASFHRLVHNRFMKQIIKRMLIWMSGKKKSLNIIQKNK